MKAFPNPNNTQEGGMDLRDWFAGLAMQAINSREEYGDVPNDLIASAAYDLADEMMEARKNENN
jgi:hypothetical protein